MKHFGTFWCNSSPTSGGPHILERRRWDWKWKWRWGRGFKLLWMDTQGHSPVYSDNFWYQGNILNMNKFCIWRPTKPPKKHLHCTNALHGISAFCYCTVLVPSTNAVTLSWNCLNNQLLYVVIFVSDYLRFDMYICMRQRTNQQTIW